MLIRASYKAQNSPVKKRRKFAKIVVVKSDNSKKEVRVSNHAMLTILHGREIRPTANS